MKGEVFRKPDLPILLCTLTGIGVQCGFMLYVMIATIIIGFINPYFRYFNFVYAFFILSTGGYFNGYVSATLMKFFGATEWKLAASASAFMLPSGIAAVFILVDFIEYFEKANQFFPLTSVAFFTALWFFITVPLAYFGAYVGFTSTTL